MCSQPDTANTQGKRGFPEIKQSVQAKTLPYSPPDPRFVLLNHTISSPLLPTSLVAPNIFFASPVWICGANHVFLYSVPLYLSVHADFRIFCI